MRKATAFDPAVRFESAFELKKAFEKACDEALDVSGDSSFTASSSPEPASGSRFEPAPAPAFNPVRDFGLPVGSDFVPALEAASAPEVAPVPEAASVLVTSRVAEPAVSPVAAPVDEPLVSENSEERGRLRRRRFSAGESFAPEGLETSSKWNLGEKIGFAWNVLVFGCALLFVCGGVLAALYPTGYDSQFPLWFRLLEYVGFLAVGSAGTAFILFDKRFLARIWPRFKGRTWKSYLPHGLFLLGVAVACLFVAAVLVSTLFADVQPPGHFQ